MKQQKTYKSAKEKIEATNYYKYSMKQRIFNEYSDQFFIFAYDWCVKKGNRVSTLCKFITPGVNCSPRDKLRDWCYDHQDLRDIYNLKHEVSYDKKVRSL